MASPVAVSRRGVPSRAMQRMVLNDIVVSVARVGKEYSPGPSGCDIDEVRGVEALRHGLARNGCAIPAESDSDISLSCGKVIRLLRKDTHE